MSILRRLSLRSDWRDELRRMFPRVTDAQLARFAILAERDNLIADNGEPSLAFMGWCREVSQ
jgi:hypothetical protein